MAAKQVIEVMHRIRAKLYPNNLPGKKGAYIARTACEASLNIKAVYAFLKNRGGFTGSYEDAVNYVCQYFEEAAYLLCNGFSIDTGYFSIHPGISGVFDTPNETFNPEKHQIGFRFRVKEKLRRMVKFITVEIEGLADINGWIGEFTNIDRDSDQSYAPGDLFCIKGGKIRIEGGDPSCGVYFVPEDDPSAAVKATRVTRSTSTKITGIAPKTGRKNNRIEVRTQFTGATDTFLQTPRVIASAFILEEL